MRNLLIVIMTILCVNVFSQSNPPTMTYNGKKLLFEQYLFGVLSSDSVISHFDKICCSRTIFIKFTVLNGKFNEMLFSPDTPVEVKEVIKKIIIGTEAQWKGIKNENYLLPISINLTNSSCESKKFIDELGITRRAIANINHDSENFNEKWLLMKGKRFSGTVLFTVLISRVFN